MSYCYCPALISLSYTVSLCFVFTDLSDWTVSYLGVISTSLIVCGDFRAVKSHLEIKTDIILS